VNAIRSIRTEAVARTMLVVLAAIICVMKAEIAWSQESYFKLTSSAFADNGLMEQKYAGKNPNNANCIGENVSPPLQWSNPPAGTKSFALIMFDQEGRLGLGVTHWLIYGIDAKRTSLPEGIGTASDRPFSGGSNILGQQTYLGACPPKGTGPHHYVFTLVATSLEPNALEPGLTLPKLLEAIGKNAIGATGLVGRFGH